MSNTQKRPFDSLEEAAVSAAGEAGGGPGQDQLQAANQAQSAEQAKIKRTRIRQACERCKSRKTKCNNQRPCAACIAAGTQCQDWRPGMEPATSHPMSQNPLGDLTLGLANDPVSLNDIDQFGQATSNTVWPAVPTLDRNEQPSFPYDSLIRNERGVQEHVSASGGIAHIAYLAKLRGVLQDVILEGEEEKEIYWPIPPVVYEPSPSAPAPESQSPYDMVESGGGWKIIHMLVRSYLESTHVLWPTFHLQPFLTSLASAKTSNDPVFICLVLAIAFVTLRSKRTRKDLSEETGIIFYHSYWKVRQAWPDRDWSSLAAVQGIVLLAMGCMGGAGVHGTGEARRLVSEAATRCLDLGLHRAHQAGFKTASEVEAGRRTFWLVYCIDKMIAVTGRPASLRLTDVDQSEITVDDPTLSERLAPPSLLAYHRTAVRLYMILERIVAKINIPACSPSATVHLIARDGGTRRFRESSPHSPACEADHRPVSFDVEIQLLDRYQYSDIPLPSREIEEDEMYKAHLARIRTMSAFCRLLIASHLFSIDNNDIRASENLRHAEEVLRWSRELLSSQRPILRQGSFPDFGAASVVQIAQVAKALLPAIHLVQSSTTHSDVPLDELIPTFRLAIQLLHGLRAKFDAVVRHLQALEEYARRLNMASATIGQAEASGDDANIDPELIEAAIAGLPVGNEQQSGQVGQTSGSGAIQALLSLSGRPGEEDGSNQATAEGHTVIDDGFEEWWDGVLNGTLGGLDSAGVQ